MIIPCLDGICLEEKKSKNMSLEGSWYANIAGIYTSSKLGHEYNPKKENRTMLQHEIFCGKMNLGNS